MADTRADSSTRFVDTMRRLLVEGGPTPDDIVLPGALDRSRLDFSLESLHAIDEYLNMVHTHEQNCVGSSLLNTIWVTSLYIGEIIRRGADARHFEWITIGDEPTTTGGTTTSQVDLGSLRALRSEDGELCLPSRAVLRVILRGRKARSIFSFARGAIEAATARLEAGISASGAPPGGPVAAFA